MRYDDNVERDEELSEITPLDDETPTAIEHFKHENEEN